MGQFLSAHLESQGWQIIGTILNGTPKQGEIVCDITQQEHLEHLMKQIKSVSHVFHLAAITSVPQSIAEPVATMKVNVEGTIRLFETLTKHSPNARFLYIGSAEAYGPSQFLPITEEHPFHPSNPYAISKATADLYFEFAFRNRDLDIVRARPFNHSGPGQSDAFALSSFARQIAQIEAGRVSPVIHVGNLEARRDFLHVRDVVRAYERLAISGERGEAYNVCSGRSYSMREALDKLVALAKVPVTIKVEQQRLRPVDIPEMVGAHDKLTKDTGWTPEIPFEKMLVEILEYWRRTGE